jgi:hypothetical protein
MTESQLRKLIARTSKEIAARKASAPVRAKRSADARQGEDPELARADRAMGRYAPSKTELRGSTLYLGNAPRAEPTRPYGKTALERAVIELVRILRDPLASAAEKRAVRKSLEALGFPKADLDKIRPDDDGSAIDGDEGGVPSDDDGDDATNARVDRMMRTPQKPSGKAELVGSTLYLGRAPR